MKALFGCLIFVVLLQNYGGRARPPPAFVNQLFAGCFDSLSNSNNINWTSVVDFIILHTSWFENSDVGSCAAGNPNVTEEANCWKRAFEMLISQKSPFLEVSRQCVDFLVKVTRSLQSVPFPSSTSDSASVRYKGSLNSGRCYHVSLAEFVEQVFDKATKESVQLGANDHTLQDFTSVAEFVREAALCEEPSCDQCNLNYVIPFEYPPVFLPCNKCWPTRLAGMIKATSPLKNVVSQVAVKLGNNIPHQPFSPSENAQVAECMRENLESEDNWISMVDFIVYHTSWFENSNIGSCGPQNMNVKERVVCWSKAYGHLVKSRKILRASQKCNRRLLTSPADNEELEDDDEDKPGADENYSRTRLSRGDRHCPKVSVNQFVQVFLKNVADTNATSKLAASDSTLNDFRFVAELVKDSYMCRRPTCDECTVSYRNKRTPRQQFTCPWCWSSRLAGMIKSSSPLKKPATDAALSFSQKKRH